MNDTTLIQILAEHSEISADRLVALVNENMVKIINKMNKKFAEIRQEIKGVKDEVENLSQKIGLCWGKSGENLFHHFDRGTWRVTMKKKWSCHLWISDAQNNLKSDVSTELNKVSQTSLEEIKKRYTIIEEEEVRMVSPNIQPNLTQQQQQQQQFKKKLKDEIKEKNSKAGHIVCNTPNQGSEWRISQSHAKIPGLNYFQLKSFFK
jgi:ElaB/YqjD/DUF883 family membrane-anchored ribosome-binding protein